MARQKAKLYNWWAQKWLDNLQSISNHNGAAGNTKIEIAKLQIRSGTITAGVYQGKHKKFETAITLKPYSKKDLETIQKAIAGRPVLMGQLLNGILSPDLGTLVTDLGLTPWPGKWEEIAMHCNCGELFPPCPHQLAVLTNLAELLQEQPDRIFSLRDFSLFEWIRTQQVSSRQEQQLSRSLDLHTVPPQNWQALPENQDPIDLSTVEECGTTLLSALSDMPLVSGENFKSFLEKAYIRTGELAQQPASLPLNNRKLPPAEDWPPSWLERCRLTLWEDYSFRRAELQLSDGRQLVFDHLDKLIRLLERAESKHLAASPALTAWYWTYRFSEKLAARGAFVPQLLRTGENDYRIRYVPATSNKSVAALSQLLAAQWREPSIFFERPDGVVTQQPAEQLISICAMLLGHWVKKAFWAEWKPGREQRDDDIIDLFFFDRSVSFDTPERADLPWEIHQWLSKFSLSQSPVSPVLKLQADGNQFAVALYVRDKRKPDAPVYTFEAWQTLAGHEPVWMHFLRDLEKLREYYPELGRLMEPGTILEYDGPAFYEVFAHTLPVLQMLGLEVILPDSLRQLIRPKPHLKVNCQTSPGNGLLSLGNLLSFDWQIALGDQEIKADVFQELVSKQAGLVQFGASYLLLEPAEVHQVLQRIRQQPQPEPTEALRILLSGEYEDVPLQISAELKDKLQELQQIPQLNPPAGLHAVLRPYQQRGFEWLYRNVQMGAGSILADDMGLGKTIQVIALLLQMKAETAGGLKSLVVAPTTLLTNWQRELCRFAPGLSTLVYHGPKRIIPKEGPDVVITSYGVVRTDLAQLQVVDWRALIIDEAQQIKNHDTDQTRAVKRLQAPVRIAMSGTPVENRLSEYWSISDFSNKGLLGNSSYFQDHFAKPIQKDQDQHKLEQFRQVVRPFILRRLKTDTSIIQDLPEKVEQNCFAQLTQEQAVMYAGLVEQSLKAIQSTGEGGIARQGLVLKMMTALKQICNHPVQFLKQGQPNPEQSGKLQLLLELVENILESGEKVLIFSQYQEMGALLGGAIEKRFGFEPLFLHGGCSRNERDRMVEVFQNHAHPSVFILSLKAGGTGLNLTAANHVIHYDLWWNPAVEAQATDRAFRIGQQRNVMVYRFVTQGTLEEKIDALLHDKKQLANLTVESGENWIGHLSNNELESLVKLD